MENDLHGCDVNVSIESIQRGGVVYDPIPGDNMRLVYDQPQVGNLKNNVTTINVTRKLLLKYYNAGSTIKTVYWCTVFNAFIFCRD